LRAIRFKVTASAVDVKGVLVPNTKVRLQLVGSERRDGYGDRCANGARALRERRAWHV
jgi:hypothetical protein